MFGVKFVIIFAVIIIAVAAVPLKSNKLNSDKHVSPKIGVQKFLRQLKLSPKNSLTLGRYQGLTKNTKEYDSEPVAEILNDRNFRLPNNTQPISYNISLSTDIHRGDFGYFCNVTINITVSEASNNITLHSRHTIIERIDLFNPNGTLFQGNAFYTYDSEVEFLVIPVTNGLVAGQVLNIQISFSGFLRTDLFGFFRTSYIDPVSNNERFLATTQFQPINARQAFPCYDEIQHRVVINLRIRHHQSYNAVANTIVTESIPDGEYVTTVFNPTIPIPVFVLAFTVSDFDSIRNNETAIDFGVIARPAAIAAGQADEGLRLAQVMLRQMEEILGGSLILDKSDQIAIPEFASDGALNLGLITHREDVILQLNNDTAAQRFRELRIAHEYSHIFFGNLVSPSSWSYLWMNEGFATLYENVLLGFVFPERDQWNQFLISYFDTAVTVDVMGLVPALNAYVESPSEVRGKFDFITYNKGAIILRMIGDSLSPATFMKGSGFHILENQLTGASPEHLYAAVQRAHDEDFPANSLNVSSLMGPWFDLPGYPIVTVSRSAQGLSVYQEGFRTQHNELYPIPITYATASIPDFDFPIASFWMTTRQAEIPRDNDYKSFTDDEWIIFNIRDTAYYLTNYDDDLWDLIIAALNTDHEAIHFLNRGTLFADFHRFLAQDFNIRATYFVRMLESLPLEFVPHVFIRAELGLGLFEVTLRDTELHRQYLTFIQGIMSDIYGVAPFTDPTAINIINELSCLSGLQQCLDDALVVLLEVMETGNTAFEYDYQCNGLRAANEATLMTFYYDLVDSTTGDRSDGLRDLLCTENEVVLWFYLNQVLNTTNSLSTEERQIIFTSAAVQHVTSHNLLIDLIEDFNEQIDEIVSISNLIFELAVVTNTEEQAERVATLLRFLPEDDPTDEEFFFETVAPNLNFITRNLEELEVFFEERNINIK